MSRKTRRPAGREKTQDSSRESRQAPPAPAAGAAAGADGGESRLNPAFFWIPAVILAVSGYFFLTKADPWGKNPWAVAAPVCLLAGYLLVVPAIYYSYRGKN